jgi:tRNA/tmRNA/rRNA uracil-C5-methylase (TrmA/RlmC/RlmD family)
MKTTFTPQERDAFAVAVSAIEGISFSCEDDAFFQTFSEADESVVAKVERALQRALKKT